MNYLGIDFDCDLVNIAFLNKSKEILDIKSLDLSEIKDVNPLYTSKNAKSIITSGLPIQDVLIKNIPLDLKKTLFIKKAINFQNNFLTSIDPQKTVTIPFIIKQESVVKFFITTKEFLRNHINKLNVLKIDPDYTICSSIALCNYATHFFHDTKNSFIIHIGLTKTYCVLMKNNLPEKTHSIKFGLKNIFEENLNNKKNNNNLDVLSLKQSNPIFEKLTTLKNEIHRALVSFSSSPEEKYPLILTGNCKPFINLERFLENEKISLILLNEILEKNSNLKNHAISIGLALHSFSKESQFLQFRKDEFTCNKKLINIGKKVFFFCAFIFIFLILVSVISFSVLKNNEKQFHEKLIHLQKFEKIKLNKDEILSFNNFYDDLDSYEKKLSKQTKDFPYFLKVPNVSETLIWINNHELLKEAELISFSYTLEKYPNINAKNEPYLVKIEIEFKTKIPSIARNFYDSVLKGEGLVNPKEEITWDVGNDSYKTSFYLKTKNLKFKT